MSALRPAVFLDRDGTINVERSFVTTPAQFQLLPGVVAAIKQLQAAGFACVVVTNQSAVGRGLMSQADLDRVHEEMNRLLSAEGVVLDGIYTCTAMPVEGVEHPDRKPAPGMLLRAAAELGLDLAGSWMIGDSERDMRAGRRAGCKGCILVRSGHPVDAADSLIVADDLHAAALYVLNGSR